MVDYFSASSANGGVLLWGDGGLLISEGELMDGWVGLGFLIEFFYYLAIIV